MTMEKQEPSRRHHLIITGTGRAGTTFLVRYLAGLGLETHLSRKHQPHFDVNARAGLEDHPLRVDPKDLPYVIKSPWLHEEIDELLAHPEMQVDCAIIPVRDLSEAAASRVAVERRAIYEDSPWVASQTKAWRSWGWSSGGAVFSLETIDQARLLAVGFHHIVERLTRADVPIIFLSYPRIIHDWNYLFSRLKPYLPREVDQQMAQQAHVMAVDRGPSLVQLEPTKAHCPATDSTNGLLEPERLDLIALRREVIRLRAKLDAVHATLPWRLADLFRSAAKRLAKLR
jgi:hypothetical protein